MTPQPQIFMKSKFQWSSEHLAMGGSPGNLGLVLNRDLRRGNIHWHFPADQGGGWSLTLTMLRRGTGEIRGGYVDLMSWSPRNSYFLWGQMAFSLFSNDKSTPPSDTRWCKRRRKMIVNLARLYLAEVSVPGVSFYWEPDREKGKDTYTDTQISILLESIPSTDRYAWCMISRSDLFFWCIAIAAFSDKIIGL